MNKLIQTTLALLIISTTLIAAPVGTKFSYQGQLQTSGSPATGEYDFQMELWSSLEDGASISTILTLEDVDVANGLFTVELDFGDTPFNGDEGFLKIQVREGTSTGVFAELSPRQRVNTVPYAIQADFLAANGASTGQVLKFDGSNWVAGTDDAGSTSPWLDAFSGIQHNGDVVIGNLAADAGDTLQINSDTGDSPLRILVGTNGTKFRVSSNGGTAIGGNFTPPTNGLYVEGITQINGDVTVGDFSIAGVTKFKINAGVSQNPLTVQALGVTKLVVKTNGGTKFGTGGASPLSNGINVAGNTVLEGDTTIKSDTLMEGDANVEGRFKIGDNSVLAPLEGIYVEGEAMQALTTHGFVKAGTVIQCGNGISGGSERFFNNLNPTDFETSSPGAGFTGVCIIDTPFPIDNAFYVVSAVTIGGLASGVLTVNCSVLASTQLNCQIINSFGSAQNGELQIIVY